MYVKDNSPRPAVLKRISLPFPVKHSLRTAFPFLSNLSDGLLIAGYSFINRKGVLFVVRVKGVKDSQIMPPFGSTTIGIFPMFFE